MSAVFLKILNMSIAASWLIAVVLVLRLLLRKAPKWISCVLWALVALRLVIPFSFESALSLIPSGETISTDSENDDALVIHSGIPVIDEAVKSAEEAGEAAPGPIDDDGSIAPKNQRNWTFIAGIVWLSGMAGVLLWGLLSYLRIKKTVAPSAPLREGVLACDDITSPFILGVFRPLIYVPSGLDGEELEYALAHEKAHLKRHDHWWKPLGFLILAVYWFNPLCWLAYMLLSRDIESACDEKVIREMDKYETARYSEALLDLSLTEKRVTACPLAFGEVGVKQRVKEILNYKKPAFWVIIVALSVCAAVAICFLTNPKPTEKAEDPAAVQEAEDPDYEEKAARIELSIASVDDLSGERREILEKFLTALILRRDVSSEPWISEEVKANWEHLEEGDLRYDGWLIWNDAAEFAVTGYREALTSYGKERRYNTVIFLYQDGKWVVSRDLYSRTAWSISKEAENYHEEVFRRFREISPRSEADIQFAGEAVIERMLDSGFPNPDDPGRPTFRNSFDVYYDQAWSDENLPEVLPWNYDCRHPVLLFYVWHRAEEAYTYFGGERGKNYARVYYAEYENGT
ncbi:MAG: M56 family metallopeptidase, partial [Lachnospiraceae bacterium]|nr:M56 family metallopeptidase [Lachnospiraceae bacterium]